MFERLRYEFVLRAESPIAHHQEVFGNTAQVFRRKVRQPDGGFAHVPFITADTMRHGLREAAAYVLLDAIGMLGDEGRLTEAALRLLFAGGLITGGSAGAVKLDEYREMVALIPSLGLLGGCAQNRAIPGKLFVDNADLICAETAHTTPDWIKPLLPGDVASCRAHVEETIRVRMDPSLDPSKRLLLTAGEHTAIARRLNASEAASESGDALEKADSKSTMLPRTFETIVAGSLFTWGCEAIVQSEIEKETFQLMIGAFLASAQVGGKRATGHGKLRVWQVKEGEYAAREVAFFRPAEAAQSTAQALALRGKSVREHYAKNAPRIREILASVVA